MRYICNNCGKIVQEHDATIHYKKGSSGLEIVAICQLCLDEYLEKTKIDTDRKDADTERMKMKRKW
jgi:predicted RNA-binding protein with PUA-like domain